jgi:hypothetical protein
VNSAAITLNMHTPIVEAISVLFFIRGSVKHHMEALLPLKPAQFFENQYLNHYYYDKHATKGEEGLRVIRSGVTWKVDAEQSGQKT